MAEPAIQHVQPHDVAAALHRLGIAEETIGSAIAQGVAERRECTKLDPPIYPGVVQWARTHRALRELLIPDGWKPDDSGNYSTVTSPDGKVAIAVATGDDRTGVDGPDPATRYPKGRGTKEIVHRNQLALFEGPQTWVLLYATEPDQVRIELSYPNEMGDDDRIRGWGDRIILPPLAITPRLDYVADDDEVGEIDVPIEPK